MTGVSAVTSISERCTYSAILFRLGCVPLDEEIFGSSCHPVTEQRNRLGDVGDHHGLVDVHLEIASRATKGRPRYRFAHDPGTAIIVSASACVGFTLARHDRRTGFRFSEMINSAKPGAGAA